MRRSNRSRLVYVSTCALLSLSHTAEAADTRPEPKPADEQRAETSSQDIIVTAQKRQESVNSVPMSITALSAGQLLEQGIRSVADLTVKVPSLTYTNGLYSAPVYTIRGVGFFDGAVGSRPTVGLYSDEVELPFAVMAEGASLDVSRVEVLKGPQGTLFGQNATGGLINYITAKPTDSLRYGGNITFGRFSQGVVDGFISGPLTSTLSVRVAARHDFGGDWQRSFTRRDSLGQRDATIARVILDWMPTDGAKFELNVNGFNDRSDTQATQLLLVRQRGPTPVPLLFSYPLPARNDRSADWTPGDYRRNDRFRQVSLRADIDVGTIGTLTSLSAYAHMDVFTPLDTDGTSLNNQQTQTTATLETASQELRLAGQFANGISYIVGANYAWYRADETINVMVPYQSSSGLFSAFGLPSTVSAGILTNARYRTKSTFGNLDYRISDTLTAHAGIRYSTTTAHADSCLFDTDGVFNRGIGALLNVFRAQRRLAPVTIPPGGCITSDASLTPGLSRTQIDEHSIPFRVGLDWKVRPGTLLYANVSRGFKGGSFPVLAATGSSQLDPAMQEKLTAYEAGFKTSLFRNSLQLNGAGFYYDYSNKQFLGKVVLSPNIFGTLQRPTNIPKSHVVGAELQASWYPFRGFAFNGGVTYLHTEIDGSYSNYSGYTATIVPLTGSRFPLTPKWSGVADARYQWDVGPSMNAFVGGSAHGQTATIFSLGRLPALGAADPNLNLAYKGYMLFDLRVGVETDDGRWRVSVWGKNVGNRYYRTAAASANDTTVGWTGMPATYGITLSFRN